MKIGLKWKPIHTARMRILGCTNSACESFSDDARHDFAPVYLSSQESSLVHAIHFQRLVLSLTTDAKNLVTQTFQTKKVHWLTPDASKDQWLSILVIHQNKVCFTPFHHFYVHEMSSETCLLACERACVHSSLSRHLCIHNTLKIE